LLETCVRLLVSLYSIHSPHTATNLLIREGKGNIVITYIYIHSK